MNVLQNIRGLFGLAMLMVLTACVTINIYFPAAAAEEAARTIVRDVLGETGSGEPPAEGTPAEETPAEAPQSGLPGPVHHVHGAQPAESRYAWLEPVLNVLISPAQAQRADINIRTSTIDGLRASMRSRNAALRPHLQSGALGFTSDALVVMRDLNQVPLRDRAAVQRLVSEENADRNALYREIARANGHPEWESDIRSTFARVWVEEAPSGFWYQDDRGRWLQK